VRVADLLLEAVSWVLGAERSGCEGGAVLTHSPFLQILRGQARRLSSMLGSTAALMSDCYDLTTLPLGAALHSAFPPPLSSAPCQHARAPVQSNSACFHDRAETSGVPDTRPFATVRLGRLPARGCLLPLAQPSAPLRLHPRATYPSRCPQHAQKRADGPANSCATVRPIRPGG